MKYYIKNNNAILEINEEGYHRYMYILLEGRWAASTDSRWYRGIMTLSGIKRDDIILKHLNKIYELIDIEQYMAEHFELFV